MSTVDRSQRSRLTRTQAAAQREFEAQIAAKMNRLREYADGLEQWYDSQGTSLVDSGMHPRHVINGMRKIANEISQPKQDKKENN